MNALAQASARASIEVPGSDGTGSDGGPLILDGLRQRPRYFDGRFLTGADLTRDQDYVRQRQADMARAAGAGVISGLQVASAAIGRGQTVHIEAGLGLTPSGDLVMLSQGQDVPLLDLAASRQLDAAMGLRQEPRVPLGRRTGLFILGLRAVEFTANPIAAYPRNLTGKRTVEDGDIIEATAIALVPWPDSSGATTLADARRAAARKIFAGTPSGMPQDLLPLAMIALERGAVRWVDAAMVRRETGADAGVEIAFGGRPRAIAEAHLLQHRAHLYDVLDDLAARALSPVFAAAQMFSLLPPAGQMPAAAIQPDDQGLRQFYFPPTVDVDLAFVPVDEIGALVEESLSLPPIDLNGAAADLDATGVLILVPVTRARFQRFANALPDPSMPVPADPGAAAAKPAFDMLSTLVAQRRRLVPVQDPAAAAQAQAEALKVTAWHAALQEAIAALPADVRTPLVWYTRRRSIAYQTRVVGVGVALSGDDVVVGGIVNANLDRLGLAKRIAAVDGQATPQATARIVALLGAPAVAGSDILTASVVSDLERVAGGNPAGTAPQPPLAPTATLPPVVSAGAPATINPALIASIQPVTLNLGLARAGLTRLALATAIGATTAANPDTPLNLSEGEVMDVAQDYSGAHVGEGLAKLGQALAAPPIAAPLDVKGTIWLGGTGKALALDAAFQAVPGEKAGDFAQLLAQAVKDQDSNAIDQLLAKMR